MAAPSGVFAGGAVRALALCWALWLAHLPAAAAQDPALGMRPLQPVAAPAGTNQELMIPRIIHQSYLPDEATLEKLSTAPRSHFRRDWRRSCQVHNPGYDHMFWNETTALTFVRDHYPDVLPYYQRAPTAVLKSDILRVMILDRLGGVWLDIDTECFAPLEPILRGYDLVAQAEWTYQLCNSHIAGVPGHPVWRQLMQWFIQKVEQHVTDPLKHTGPVALTTLVKAHIQPANPERNMSKIGGAWIDPAYPSGQFRAYGLQEAWFLPCRWARSYMSPCQGKLARTKAIVRQLTNGVTVALEAAGRHDATSELRGLVQEARTFMYIRGSHEYANSWTTWQFSDGLKSMVRAQEALLGLRPFFSNPALFEEYRGWVPGGCGSSADDIDALHAHQVCGAVLRAASALGACKVLSIRGRREQQATPNASLPLDFERFVAEKYGCRVEVVGLTARQAAQVEQGVEVRGEPLQLGPGYDQYSQPPTLPLSRFLDMVLKPDENLTLLHIDCAAECRLWDVLNELPLSGSLALRRVGSLVVDLGGLPSSRRHMLNTVYQHLYQEVGMVGYSWGRSRVRPKRLWRAAHGPHRGQAHDGAVSRSLKAVEPHRAGAGLASGETGSEQGTHASHGRALLAMPAGRMGPEKEFKLPRLRLGFARVA